jgi:hypothetical protein
MINEAIYVTFDFKSEYIDFFQKKGGSYKPTPEARNALEELFGRSANHAITDFEHAFGFESIDKKKLVPATT